MVRWFVIISLALFWAMSAQAKISAVPPVIAKTDLRQAIYDQDFDRVETSIAQTQQMFRDGKATSEDVRILFEVFSTTNPKVIAFTEQWLREMPDSPYAHVAQAWILYRSGWLIRGDRWARETYPMAMRLHSSFHARALEHARIAYASDQYLLPASDAILRLGNTGGDKMGAFAVLDETMQRFPNWGTLYRALDLANKGYGGSSELAEGICAYYGPMFTSPVQNMTRFCRIEGIFRGRIEGGRKALKILVDQEKDGPLDYIRAWLAIDINVTREEAEFARWYFQEYETTDYILAQNFDRYLAFRFNFEFVEPQTVERAIRRAEIEIEHDPYNPQLLDTLAMSVMTKERTSDSVKSYSSGPFPSAEQRLDHARRKLLVTPYNPDYWRNYGSALRGVSAAKAGYGGGLTKADDAQINAIVYSRHDPQRVFAFLTEKLWQLQSLEDFNALYPKEQWAKDAAETDIESQIICPLLRTQRLLQLINADQDKNSENMRLSSEQLTIYAKAESWAQRHYKCRGELQSPADTLWFEPIEFDLKPGVY